MDNLYYEIAMPLRRGKDLLGGIGVFNPKDLGNFTSKDILILEKLSGFISNAFNNYIQLNKVSYEQEFLKDMTLEAPIGIAVLNNSYSIIYSNNIATDFCLDILSDKTCLNPIQHVIDKVFLECQFKKEDSSSFLYTTMNSYSFKIVSSIVSDAFTGLESLMYVYITKEVSNDDKTFDRIVFNYNLTNREMEVINLVFKGLSNKEISQRLFISCHTVKTHMENIFKKMQVNNRTSLIYKINNII
ncbi:response regulator transcription factor [Clostridium uliginosum]|uniref:response regulator transcription factor n=1 Tax=Clostridium uliginosum TaxID=119641 RepID=UPI000B7E5E6B|nr:helix-turn-helix transcriptional regulator [Clostridium uliginosum]